MFNDLHPLRNLRNTTRRSTRCQASFRALLVVNALKFLFVLLIDFVRSFCAAASAFCSALLFSSSVFPPALARTTESLMSVGELWVNHALRSRT